MMIEDDARTRWELVAEGMNGASLTSRLPVPGGWLYREVVTYRPPKDSVIALTFVPNPEYLCEMADRIGNAILLAAAGTR